MNILIDNYLYSQETTELNNDELFNECMRVEDFLIRAIQDPAPLQDYGCFTSANYNKYNLFNFHTKNINKLFGIFQKYIKPTLDKNEQYMIQCWLNVFREGQFIDWHAHWPAEHKVTHGYYCVNVGDSITSYKFPSTGVEYDVSNKNGLLVFGESAGDFHKSSAWTDKSKERITIAFDILPIFNIADYPINNHYVPF